MANLERQIADSIAEKYGLSVTKLGLRFDKVAARLVENLRAIYEQDIPLGKAIIVIVTAPIKLPAKTENDIRVQIDDFLKSKIVPQDKKIIIHQNAVCLRVIETPPKQTIKFVGLVHNPTSDATLLLNLISKWFKEDQIKS